MIQRSTCPFAVLALLASAVPALAQGTQIGADDFEISRMGDTNPNEVGVQAAVSYNPMANEFLVVWAGNEQPGGVPTGYEIYGQRIDAATGAEVGPDDFRISTTGNEGTQIPQAQRPDVVYNPDDDEYLVVWHVQLDLLTEIRAQRLDGSTGAEIGDDFEVSHLNDLSIFYSSLAPAVTYSPNAGEYLVVYEGFTTSLDVHGQRLQAPGGQLVGVPDFRISDAGPAGRSAYEADVAHDPVNDRYLVVWEGSDVTLAATETEIFGQLVDAATGGVVQDDFRFSAMGPDGDFTKYARSPSVAYNATTGGFFTAWWGVDPNSNGHIFGQLLDAAGLEVGPDDFGISANPPGAENYVSLDPTVAHDPSRDELFVVWDRSNPLGGKDVYAKTLDATTGALVEVADVRLSEIGVQGGTAIEAKRAAVAHASATGEYLAVFEATTPATSGDDEIHGQRYLPVPVPAGEVVRLGSPANPAAFLPGTSSAPIVGQSWDPVVDHTTFVPGAVLDLLGVSVLPANVALPYGTLLIDLAAPPLLFNGSPGVPFSIAIPSSSSYVGVALSAQAGSSDGLTFELANAIDFVIGSS